jgi:chromosome segregation ATPase
MIRDKSTKEALDILEHELSSQEAAIESYQDVISRLENQLEDKDSRIEDLELKVKSLEEALIEMHLTSEDRNGSTVDRKI